MSTPYDEVTYPNQCHPQSGPDRLATVAGFFGLEPAPPDRCRVLELGCGDGTNLLSLAWRFPESRFVGIDLAESVIEAGRREADEAGVRYLELVAGDLRGFLAPGEPFDYIIAHGVYSWVPPEVREGLLAVCAARLAPGGLAFVSYNCLPGCHIRRMVREIMLFHTRAVADPAEKVRQAVAVCSFIANSIEKPDSYRQIFREQLLQIQKLGPGHLFHDDLATFHHPVHFHEFIQHAAAHGLQYVAEADFFEMPEFELSPEARAVFRQMEGDRLTREQYLDFVKCRRFRQTILCRAGVEVCHPMIPERAALCHVSTRARGDEAAADLGSRSLAKFSEPRGGALEVDHPLAKAALGLAASRWPATLPFDELLELARALVPGAAGTDASAARACLAGVLFEAYRAGVVELHRVPVRGVAGPSERPRAWGFTRWQAGRRAMVTTLRGENLRIDDEEGRWLLRLLDGTRTVPELVAELRARLPATPENAPEAVAERLRERLAQLGPMAVLEA